MSARWLFAGIGALAMLAGSVLWMATRPAGPGPAAAPTAISIAPGALLAATFQDEAGRNRSLGELTGRVLVVNFWATWCGPCREEMPAFSRLQARWADRGVRFVGLANEEPSKVHPFGKSLSITYPLWTGGEEVPELSRRLGNAGGVLPHTAIITTSGEVVETRVGPYTEAELETVLSTYASKTQQVR